MINEKLIEKFNRDWEPGLHRFDRETGICEFCGMNVSNAKSRLCCVIHPQEVRVRESDCDMYV